MSESKYFMPETPGGSVLVDLKAKTEQGAWDKLRNSVKHMPYKTKQDLINRGYRVNCWTEQVAK